MINRYLRLSNPSRDFLVKFVIGLGLVCLAGPVVITIRNAVPITLQTLALLFVAIGLGWRLAGIISVFYLVLAMAGLPILAGYVGGIENLNTQFGGFFFGFVMASIACGFMAESPIAERPILHFLIWVAGHAIVLLLGGFWLQSLNPLGWKQMMIDALPGAGIKSALGFLMMQVFLRIVKGRKAFYNSTEK